VFLSQKYNRIILLVILFISLQLQIVQGEDRLVLIESFVNDDCLSCATFNALLKRVENNYQGQIVLISYHLWWPDDKDPFYLAAGDEATTRRDYYNEAIFELPSVMVNGEPFLHADSLHRTDYTHWSTLLDSIIVPSDFTINLQRTIVGSTIQIVATISPNGTTGTQTLTAYLVVIEKKVVLDETPGINGEKEFYGIVRDILPLPDGQEITIGQSDITLDYEFTLDQRWDSSQVATVFFLQDPQTHEVYQTAIEQTHFKLHSNVYQQITPNNNHAIYNIDLHNYEESNIDYLLNWDNSGPLDWNISVQFDGSPISDSSVVSVEPQSTKEITLDILPYSPGETEVLLTVTALDDSSSCTQFFTTISDVPLLLVDDDGFFDYEKYFQPILDNWGIQYGRWERTYDNLSTDELSNTEAIIWWTGLSSPTLDKKDQTLLENYLNGGGDLFITGQDIGYDLCDSTYAYFDSLSGSKEFYETFLSAIYESDIAVQTSLQGTNNLFDTSLDIDIIGSGGADNQYFPSIISPISPAQTVLQYEANKAGGIYYELGDRKVVYFSFGFEAIDNEDDRQVILEDILSYFGVITGTPLITDNSFIPQVWIKQNYPNPFNAKTVIRFGTQKNCEILIQIFDILGRNVTTLFQRIVEAGQHQVIFDADGLPSGIYFCRAQIGEYSKVFKMSLLR